MKRNLLWGIGAIAASAMLVTILRAEDKVAPKPGSASMPMAQPAGANASKDSKDKIAFTFKDEPQMREFATMWQQRQVILARMAVLQNYWNQEQGNLSEINQKFLSQYNLDVNKNYALDPDRKVLLERELPASGAAGEQPGAAKAGTPAATPAKASKP